MPDQRQQPPPRRLILSVPVSSAQRDDLLRRAGRQPLSAYARDQLFPANDNRPVRKRQARGSAPVKDHAALAKILALLGKSEAGSSLRELAALARIGALPITPETEAALFKASAEISDIKALLMQALGVRER